MGNDVSQDSQKYGQPLLNDMSVTWTKSKSVFPFSARDGHSSCALGNKVYVFGGVIHGEPGQITEVNDLLVFDVGEFSYVGHMFLKIHVSLTSVALCDYQPNLNYKKDLRKIILSQKVLILGNVN